jgi:hypothetical protein
MRLPQVSERIKEVPAQALRGVFAGIGQLLLITDKLRNKTPAGQQVPRVPSPERSETTTPASPARPAPAAADTARTSPEKAPPAAGTIPATAGTAPPAAGTAPPAARVAKARDFDKTGNVRLLPSKEAGAGGAPPAAGETVTPGEAATAPVTAEAAAPRAAGAPLPKYDELSIASLRARLRNLDVAQVRALAEYEKAHASRADVLAMYERRIAKLEAGRSDDAQGEAAAEAGIEARAAVEAEVRAELEAEAEDET